MAKFDVSDSSSSDSEGIDVVLRPLKKEYKTELKHYEKRIEKLNQIQAEYLLKSQFKDKSNGHYDQVHHHTDKDTMSIFEDKIKRHERVVEKLHDALEGKLKLRHLEL